MLLLKELELNSTPNRLFSEFFNSNSNSRIGVEILRVDS